MMLLCQDVDVSIVWKLYLCHALMHREEAEVSHTPRESVLTPAPNVCVCVCLYWSCQRDEVR